VTAIMSCLSPPVSARSVDLGSTTSSTTAVHFGRVSPEKDTFPPPRTFVPCAVCLTTDCAFQEKNARPSSERLWTPTKTTIKARTTNGILSPYNRRPPSLRPPRGTSPATSIQGASSATQAQASSVERQPTRTSSVPTRIVHSGKVQVSPPSPHPRTPRSSSSPT